jgi:ribonuclease VapC
MVIDTSAILSILLKEQERERFIEAIETDPVRLMSAVNAFEAAIVIEARKHEPGGREFDLLLHKAQIEISPFTAEHLEVARSAWRKYGKGKHPANLNICDCCAYALSKISGEPLLFKGADFEATDAVPSLKEAG